MGLIRFRRGEHAVELEQLVSNLPIPGLTFSYGKCGQKKEEEQQRSIYLVPLEILEGRVKAVFPLNGKIAEAPIGLRRRHSFLLEDHYAIRGNGSVQETTIDSNRLDLPLVVVPQVYEAIGTTKNGEFFPHEGSPFPILGIRNGKEAQPIVFVSETDDGLQTKGLYLSPEGNIVMYNHYQSNLQEEIRAFLHSQTRKPATVSVSPLPAITKTQTPQPETRIEIVTELDWGVPRTLVAYLNRFVVGQEQAKMSVAVAFSSYMIRAQAGNEELPRDNLMLIGPSGVGKTYMISLLARHAALPMVQAKLTGKSSEGYKGENLSTIWAQLRAQTEGDMPYGIVFFDEVDKIARSSETSNFGSRLQDELIGWVEDATVTVEMEKNKTDNLNTRNLLFVTAGAFQGDHGPSLRDIIYTRIGYDDQKIGFGKAQQPQVSRDNLLHKVRPQDLIQYGLKPELVGRLPVVAVLDELTEDQKVRILTATERSPLRPYTQLLALKGFQVELDPEVPRIIAGLTPPETGARALRAICNDLFTELLFEPERYATDRKITVTPTLAHELINLYG